MFFFLCREFLRSSKTGGAQSCGNSVSPFHNCRSGKTPRASRGRFITISFQTDKLFSIDCARLSCRVVSKGRSDIYGTARFSSKVGLRAVAFKAWTLIMHLLLRVKTILGLCKTFWLLRWVPEFWVNLWNCSKKVLPDCIWMASTACRLLKICSTFPVIFTTADKDFHKFPWRWRITMASGCGPSCRMIYCSNYVHCFFFRCLGTRITVCFYI